LYLKDQELKGFPLTLALSPPRGEGMGLLSPLGRGPRRGDYVREQLFL